MEKNAQKSVPDHGKSRAVAILGMSGVPFSIHMCCIRPETKDYAQAVALAIQVDRRCLLRTLVVRLDSSELVSVLVPASARMAPKRLAAAFGARNAALACPEEAELATGYPIGGISPLGQRTATRIAIDETALDHPTVYISGGRPGLVLGVEPKKLVDLCNGLVAPLTDRLTG